YVRHTVRHIQKLSAMPLKNLSEIKYFSSFLFFMQPLKRDFQIQFKNIIFFTQHPVVLYISHQTQKIIDTVGYTTDITISLLRCFTIDIKPVIPTPDRKTGFGDFVFAKETVSPIL